MANGLVNSKEIKAIASKIADRGYQYDYVGLRVQDSTYGMRVGDEITHESNHWYDGEMLPETVGGICAVDADLAVNYNLGFGAYSGNVILVIGSNSALGGDDDGEIVMRQSCGRYPTILDIIYV